MEVLIVNTGALKKWTFKWCVHLLGHHYFNHCNTINNCNYKLFLYEHTVCLVLVKSGHLSNFLSNQDTFNQNASLIRMPL